LQALRSQLRKNEAGKPAASSAGSYVEKYRDFKYQETLFDLFMRQFELAKVDEAREGAVIQVVDVALPPERKSRPMKALITVLTTFAACIILLAWIFAKKAIASTASRSDEVNKVAAIRAGVSRFSLWKQKSR
jgi:uncharacterized protein involved in exopolysaccharide biosynthesis